MRFWHVLEAHPKTAKHTCFRFYPRFQRLRENSLPAQKIPCIFPARAQKIPCSPAQGILPQGPQFQGLFDADFREKGRIPC